jgi:hypothetical protein
MIPGTPLNRMGMTPGTGTGTEADQEAEVMAGLAAQVQQLSKQLLQKQGAVLELQAERAALKSRVQDLQAR